MNNKDMNSYAGNYIGFPQDNTLNMPSSNSNFSTFIAVHSGLVDNRGYDTGFQILVNLNADMYYRYWTSFGKNWGYWQKVTHTNMNV